MYELDIRVREHDPAWPLLASAPEAKASFRSLPNVPKIQTKAEPTVLDVKPEPKSASLTNKTVISASRDPRLNRKRKSPQESVASSEEYLIDRSGDRNMESVARKQGKQADANDSSKKVMLFGGEDCDMRSQNAVQASPARSSAWSDYIGKHSEVGSRREAKDIDMRFNLSDPPTTSSTSFGIFEKISKEPLDVLVTSKPASVPVAPPASKYDTPERLEPNDVPPGKSFRDSNADIKLQPGFMRSENVPPRYSKMNNFALPKEHHPPPRMPDFPRDRPQLASSFQPPAIPPARGPPIRGPVWSVEINGFPDMVNIGVDPRMLSLVTHPKPPRRITIDGQQFTLLLDRVQPLIAIEDRIHAVRFRCDCANVIIDGRCFNIPGTGFTRVSIGPRQYVAYLGGPGHELVIDGRPHTVPITSHLTFINVGLHSVGVKFVGNVPRNVNVLPPIPPRLLKWAGQGLFGSPRNLFMAPLNPIKELSRLVEHGSCSRNNIHFANKPLGNGKRPLPMRPINASNSDNQSNDQKLHEVKPDTSSKSEKPVPIKEESPSNASSSLDINVHELFQKLVKAGIVPNTEPEKKVEPPELACYSWERFKSPYSVEIDELYNGHQCGQCGLRFQSDLSPEFAKHLDYHYMKNSSCGQERRSRNFYQSLQYWLISEMTREGAPQFEPGSPIHDLQEYKCAAFADPSKNVCGVCYENFEVVWDHEEEEWMLQDAIRVDDKVYHPICQEDAGKEFSIEDERKFPPPIDPVENKPESTCSPENIAKEDDVGDDENAFTCDDFSTNATIPGLSPSSNSPQQQSESEISEISLKTEAPECDFHTSMKTETILSNSTISADPLAALKAVLKGDISSLSLQPH
ncbi:Pre-mRNA cleavage complex 2 protein Pcf11 [Schistosoma japonicum]|nr:Pre-mRNA cleavage complex 2 protein Pcf11 [Schistosoma japonicum]KAH8877772.1 Pre-mRNA cleavage complex 2 protein Pcf11 [Schistosoma japonicum]KAH8877773.1 Pre-mRNA cleavage complex 2 protein Pcf11 [Schistosoma japonicum]